MKIGIIGAGRLGQALATRLVAAGHAVMISNSRGREAVLDTARALGCEAGSAADAAAFGDVVVVSVPLKAFADLPADAIGSRIVIDTCNYYPGRDGPHPQFEGGGETTTGHLRKALPRARIAKAFNSVLAPHLAKGGMPVPGGDRHALPIAGDDPEAVSVAGRLVEDAGFAVVMAGPVAESWRFERARPGYCRVLGAAELRRVLEATLPTDFVPEGSWRS